MVAVGRSGQIMSKRAWNITVLLRSSSSSSVIIAGGASEQQTPIRDGEARAEVRVLTFCWVKLNNDFKVKLIFSYVRIISAINVDIIQWSIFAICIHISNTIKVSYYLVQ